MPLQLGSRTGVLDGVVSVDEAEPLAAWLRTTPSARINLQTCTHLHAAALTALLAANVKVTVPPADDFLRTWVLPLLMSEAGAEPSTDTSPDDPDTDSPEVDAER